MKLKRYELDAVVSKTIDKISSKIKVPDFTEELRNKKKLHDQYVKLLNKKDAADYAARIFAERNKLNNYYLFRKDKYGNIKPYSVYKDEGEYPKFDIIENKKKLIEQYLSEKLPTYKTLENDVILADNKDLNKLVEEIVAKYV